MNTGERYVASTNGHYVTLTEKGRVRIYERKSGQFVVLPRNLVERIAAKLKALKTEAA